MLLSFGTRIIRVKLVLSFGIRIIRVKFIWYYNCQSKIGTFIWYQNYQNNESSLQLIFPLLLDIKIKNNCTGSMGLKGHIFLYTYMFCTSHFAFIRANFPPWQLVMAWKKGGGEESGMSFKIAETTVAQVKREWNSSWLGSCFLLLHHHKPIVVLGKLICPPPSRSR